jgi:hypothetical protein
MPRIGRIPWTELAVWAALATFVGALAYARWLCR